MENKHICAPSVALCQFQLRLLHILHNQVRSLVCSQLSSAPDNYSPPVSTGLQDWISYCWHWQYCWLLKRLGIVFFISHLHKCSITKGYITNYNNILVCTFCLIHCALKRDTCIFEPLWGRSTCNFPQATTLSHNLTVSLSGLLSFYRLTL